MPPNLHKKNWHQRRRRQPTRKGRKAPRAADKERQPRCHSHRIGLAKACAFPEGTQGKTSRLRVYLFLVLMHSYSRTLSCPLPGATEEATLEVTPSTGLPGPVPGLCPARAWLGPEIPELDFQFRSPTVAWPSAWLVPGLFSVLSMFRISRN